MGVASGRAEVWMTILESGWNLWVWLVGMVSRSGVESMGMVTMYRCGQWVLL